MDKKEKKHLEETQEQPMPGQTRIHRTKLEYERSRQPMRLARAEQRKRARQKRERRMIGVVLLVLLVISGAFYGIRTLFRSKDVAKKPTQQTSLPVGNAGGAGSIESATSAVVGNATGAGQSDVSTNGTSQAPGAVGQRDVGFAQPKADTNDVKQNAGGKGTNHNKASSIYAYPVGEVKKAMEGKAKFPAGKVAFLTFDDGVDRSSTPKLLDTLKDLGVPATFFMVGRTFKDDNKDLLERTLNEGHALALHSFTHDYSTLYPGRKANPDAIQKELVQSSDALKAVLGQDVECHVWRYPGGRMSWKNMEVGDKALAEKGVDWIDWNAMTGDAEPKRRRPTTTKGQVDQVLASWAEWGKPDVVCILMHDGRSKTLTRESVGEVVKALRNEGFSFGILE